MNRQDLIANERHAAATYRREAAKRSANPRLAARLIAWAEASERRAEELRFGPLFGGVETFNDVQGPERGQPAPVAA